MLSKYAPLAIPHTFLLLIPMEMRPLYIITWRISGVVLPDTGVAMNNFLGETDVAHPLLMQNPGQRIITMYAPVILQSPSQVYALGTGGSSRIPGASHSSDQSIMDNQFDFRCCKSF